MNDPVVTVLREIPRLVRKHWPKERAMSECMPNDIVTLIGEVQRNIETSRLMLKSAVGDKDLNEAIRYLSIAIDGCIRARDEMEGLRAMGKERLTLPWMKGKR